MATNGTINISKYLLGNNQKTTNTKTTTTNTTNTTVAPLVKSSIWRILSYILAIIIVILVILLFIHFFITPIFKLRPGAPGLIPVPGLDDGTLFWNKTSPGLILNKDLPISSLSYNYTLNLDVFIQNPLQFSTSPRVFFTRGALLKEKPEGDTLLGIMTQYNLAAALLSDTNDMVVSVVNKDNNMESVVIPNVPIQEPFRLSVVVMEQAMEVYINGHLMKTRHFASPPMDIKGDIYPATGILANMAILRNLKIWSRILTTTEIRESTPSLSTAKDFGAGPMPTSSTCSTAASNLQSDLQTGMQGADRLSKLSVNTIPDIPLSIS